jgi:hypothetical protein
MAIETICQGCSKKLRVADEHAGKQARCPECGMIYTVPNATISSYSLMDEPYEAASAPLPSQATQTFANPPAKEAAEMWLMKIDDGREFGPVDRTTLDQWYAERRIGSTTRLKRQNDYQWQPASNVYPSLAAANVSGSSTTAHSNPFAEQAYTPTTAPLPGRAPMAYAEPHRGALVLILALVSWFVGCFPIGIVAWAMAAGDLRKMRQGQMDPSGDGLTRAGMVIAIIHVSLTLIVLFLVLLLMVASMLAD